MSCSCNTSFQNLGSPSCKATFATVRKLVFVPLYKSDGTKNSILSTDTVNGSYILDKINAVDRSERWYFSPSLENVETTRAEALKETFNSGKSVRIQQGIRTFMGMMVKEPTQLIEKLESAGCTKFGVYMVDVDGNLIGSVSLDGTELYPIPVDADTLDALFVFATDSTTSKIQLSFEFDRKFQDGSMRFISAETIDYDLLGESGLVDSFITIETSDQTSATLSVSTVYGEFSKPIMVSGLELADFTLYNVTDASSVTISTVTESSDGVYVIEYPSQTLADTLRISASQDGFDIASATTVV